MKKFAVLAIGVAVSALAGCNNQKPAEVPANDTTTEVTSEEVVEADESGDIVAADATNAASNVTNATSDANVAAPVDNSTAESGDQLSSGGVRP